MVGIYACILITFTFCTLTSNKSKETKEKCNVVDFSMVYEGEQKWHVIGNGEYLEIDGDTEQAQEKAELRLMDLGYKNIRLRIYM